MSSAERGDRRSDTMLAFVVSVPADDVDLASDRLWQLGVRAVEERPVGDGGVVELWTSVGQEPDRQAAAGATLDPTWGWRVVEVSTVAADTWREHVQPVWLAADLVIVPAWLSLDVAPGVTRVMIEPAGAFGLGDHPTSQLSAQAVRSHVRRRAERSDEPITVLDVGCGTGVLSIVAAMAGASRVRAIDLAAEAVAATSANAALNDVGTVIEVDDSPVDQVEGRFDVVVANILAPVLVSMARDLERLVADDGTLIVSGVLADSHDHVVAALTPLRVVEAGTRDGWAVLTLRREG